MSVEQRQRALGEYVVSVQAVSAMISAQVGYDIDAFERTLDRPLGASERAHLVKTQKRSFKRAYIGAGVTHPKFLATVDSLAPNARDILAPLLQRMQPARSRV